MTGGSDPVTQRELDAVQRGNDAVQRSNERRLDAVETWQREHDREHDRAHEQRDNERAETRRWSWQQIAAWAAVAAVLAAAWVTSTAGK